MLRRWTEAVSDHRRNLRPTQPEPNDSRSQLSAAERAEAASRYRREFVELLNQLRVQAGGPSYREISHVAERNGVRISKSTLSDWLNGRTFPGDLSTVEMLARIFLHRSNLGPGQSRQQLDMTLATWQRGWAELRLAAAPDR
jgi:transcriptional regulator with XRE-family HTH domain